MLLFSVLQSYVTAQTGSALETLTAVSAGEQLDRSGTRELPSGLNTQINEPTLSLECVSM